ncbi:MAG: phosphoribosylglycinamide formyltransferase [Gammaproteobacteria bacterium]
MLKTVVLIGGSGTNLQRLIDLKNQGGLAIKIQAVISHRPDAYGLERAKAADIPTLCLDHTCFPKREAFEAELKTAILEMKPDLIILAGFMRILSADFVNTFAGTLINIHPSRLPLFKGLNTHEAALAAGVRVHGATVHFVTADLDGGPIIAQTTVTISPAETAESLKLKVQISEYELYPQVIRWFAEKRLCLRQDGVYLDNLLLPQEGIQL